VEQLESEVSELQDKLNNLIKEYVICKRSWYGRRSKIVREIERTGVELYQQNKLILPDGKTAESLEDISQVVREGLKHEGETEQGIKDAIKLLQPEHKRAYEKGRSPLSDQEFEEDTESVFDQVEEFATRTLSDKQLDQLSPAERKEVLEQEIGTRKSRKTIDNDRIKHLQEYATKKGIELVEKISKQLPPEHLRGQSEVHGLLGEAGTQFKIISDMFYDLQRQVYNFKPTNEVDRKAKQELEQYFEKVFIPLTKVVIEHCEGTKTILRNITDEKYSDTNSGWMRNAEDKFMSFGNHGSGEVNAVLTNKVVLKLGFKEFKDEDGNILKHIPVIVRTQVKRETTREEIGDKTLIEPVGQLDITCPNCQFEFNRPYLPDEYRDLIAGDLFHQAKTTLLNNGLSNAIDTLANNTVTEYVKDPQQWFKEKYGNKYFGITPEIKEDIEKIKNVDIDPNDITEKRHGMLKNAATRRLEKSQHFSDQA